MGGLVRAGRERVRAGRPDVDANRSIWVRELEGAAGAADPAGSAPLSAQITADVVILGGGFTGVSTAWHLRRRFPELRIALLEAREIGSGASGRNGGQLLNWINGVPHDDPEVTRGVYDLTSGAIDRIVAMIHDEGLGVPLRREGSFELFTDARRAEEAAREVARLQSWGIPVQWLDAAAARRRLGSERAQGAIYDPFTGMMNGLALLRAMRARLAGQGVEFYEHSPAIRVREGKTIEVETPQGGVRAAAMVLGLNGYAPRLGYFRHAICPMHAHNVATEPMDEAGWRRAGWRGLSSFCDDLDRISYAGITPGGSLLFGGGGNFAYGYGFNNATSWPQAATEAAAARVRGRMLDYLPGLADLPIRAAWSGTLGVTLDRTCSMGVRGEYKNVYYALGYSGHGVTLANLAGEVLCDLYSGDHARWRGAPFYQRRLYPMPGEPLRWLGYHMVTTLTGRSPRRRG